MKKKLLAILTILTLVVSHERRFLGGNASFYAAQVGGSATLAAASCAVTIMQFNPVTGVVCIATFAYYLFASVGYYITTRSVPKATTAKRSLM